MKNSNPKLKDKFPTLELYESHSIFYNFRLLNGDIKTIIEYLYCSKIKEIENHQNKDNFKEYLIKQREFLEFLKEILKSQLSLNSNLKSEIKFAIARIKQLQNIILIYQKNEENTF